MQFCSSFLQLFTHHNNNFLFIGKPLQVIISLHLTRTAQNSTHGPWTSRGHKIDTYQQEYCICRPPNIKTRDMIVMFSLVAWMHFLSATKLSARGGADVCVFVGELTTYDINYTTVQKLNELMHGQMRGRAHCGSDVTACDGLSNRENSPKLRTDIHWCWWPFIIWFTLSGAVFEPNIEHKGGLSRGLLMCWNGEDPEVSSRVSGFFACWRMKGTKATQRLQTHW